MAEPTPLRPGIVPEVDFGRELLDFCATRITQYIDDNCTAPTSIALVLSGHDDDRRYTDAYHYDASETRTKLETCSVASAVLLKRAME